jgi:hypothetical protein
LPTIGPLPVTWHTRAIILPLFYLTLFVLPGRINVRAVATLFRKACSNKVVISKTGNWKFESGFNQACYSNTKSVFISSGFGDSGFGEPDISTWR